MIVGAASILEGTGSAGSLTQLKSWGNDFIDFV